MTKNNPIRPKVSFFQRKPREIGNYSIEFIFKDVRWRLKDLIEANEVHSKFESSGVLKRIYNCIEIIGKQGDVNHITGDINYVGIFLTPKKTIQTIHDCVSLSRTKGVKHAILKFFWLTIPVNRSRFITAISESTKKEILKYSSCNPDKIIVIPVAISDRFQSHKKTFNADNPRIFQLGTAPNKNIPRLIEALQNIRCILDIVGKHEMELEELLKKYKINYEYKQGLSDDEIIQKYRDADIVSLVSTYEGFGMPILEGQAIGRPIITSNISSMPQVAGNGACLVDPYNIVSIREGITKIINDSEYRNDLLCKGFENVKRYDPDKIAIQYYNLYKKVAEGN